MPHSFYRLYQFLVIDWTVQFHNELEYFWTRVVNARDLSDLSTGILRMEEIAEDARIRKAFLAGHKLNLARALNRLISESFPEPSVDDWDELRAQLRVLEKILGWAGEIEALKRLSEIVTKRIACRLRI